MKIIRVFPEKTKFTPEDPYAFIGRPPFKALIPEHDEIHISCTFTWQKGECEQLKYQWEAMTSKPVRLGGVAYQSPCDTFTPGLYVKHGITFTTRGCNNQCQYCVVPRNEGKLKELPITPGNIIQDNNFLQASRAHKDKVFDMLRTQKTIVFAGGLDIHLIDEHFIQNAQSLRIKQLFIACDGQAAIPKMQEKVHRLRRAGFNRDKIHCYALIGDNMDENENRCRAIYAAGALPRAQLFREYAPVKTAYSRDWVRFASMWQRPAATRMHMEKGTNYWEFSK